MSSDDKTSEHIYRSKENTPGLICNMEPPNIRTALSAF